MTDFADINPRICKICFNLAPQNITIISAHAPTEDKEDEENTEFYEELETVLDHSPQFDMKIILRDINSKIDKEGIFFPTIRRHSLHNISNKNGKHLFNFASAKGMVISNTWFSHKLIHKGTWKSPNGKTTKLTTKLIMC